MEQLKLILKNALSQGAIRVSIKAGEEVKLTLQHDKIVSLKEFGNIESTWLENLYKSLFPRDGLAIRAEQPVRSQFSIVNLGKVNAIGDPRTPKSLYLFFPPTGDLASQDFWIGLTTKQGPAKVESAPTQIMEQATQVVPPPARSAALDHAAPSTPSGATTVRAPIGQTGLHILKDIPADVMKNKEMLSLAISDDASLVEKMKSVAASLKLYGHQTQSLDLLNTVLDRMPPKLIFLDEKINGFHEYLKRLYDLIIEKRGQMTIILISSTLRTDDNKAAFANSVDGIVHTDSLNQLEELTIKFNNTRLNFFEKWVTLMSKM